LQLFWPILSSNIHLPTSLRILTTLEGKTISYLGPSGIRNPGHTHPHDAIFLDNGDVVVAIWKGHEAGSLGGIEYWTHLGNQQ
jgi:hypothetical protein